DRPSYERRRVKIGDGTTAQVRGLVRPVLARDGSKIAFAALGDLWTVSPSGGVPIALTRDEYLDSDPFWSPDSRSIVYSSDRGGTMDLWVKDVDSPRSDTGRRLTMDIGAELAPAWSPDGTHIAYVDERARLHVLSVESGTNEVLTEARRGVSQPTWSSDSIHVALSVHVPLSTRFREGYNRILIVNTRTRASRILHEVDRSIGASGGASAGQDRR
ncbi:MAG: Protein TolB, partial [Alphaproteobacteria bacterium MarineAlpha10_Bin2]